MKTRMKKMQTNNMLLLSDLLQQTVQETLGKDTAKIFDAVRSLSGQATSGNETAAKELQQTIEGLSDEVLLQMAQTFNQTLNLINTTEQLSAVSEHAGGRLNPIRFIAQCKELKQRGCSEEQIKATIEHMTMDLVLTAHPTETNRRSLINNLNETSQCLAELERTDLPEYKRTQITRRLRQLILQYWYTDEIRKKRPTPEEEAKWGNDVVETSLWYAVPEFIRELNAQLAQALNGYSLPIDARPVQFSAWMGGDRDGNPNVTAAVTRSVLLENRKRAAKLFLEDIEALVKELSMSACTEEFRAYLGDNEVQEPYRELMKRLRTQLRETITYFNNVLTGVPVRRTENIIYSDAQLWEPLIQCYHSLIACGMQSIADDKLTDTLHRVRCFGVTLVKTDIRQESTRHTEAISEILRYLGIGDYTSWSEEEKQAFLVRELSSRRPLIPRNWTPSTETAEVLDTCKVIAETPEGVIPVYIISMAQTPSDVLAVHLLLKETNCPYYLPVAPLFETLNDLENAADVLKRLFNIGWYRGTIKNKQMVMIGYSDSAKDAGALAAGWAQYCAQEALISLCEEEGVQLTLFHGRGGTIGRGGGPARTALFSQPPGSLRGGLRVTEQGEMIRFKFGQPAIALRSLSRYVEAILEANLLPPPAPKPEWRALMDKLRDDSCEIYQSVVRGNKDFIDYFSQATPITELSKLPLGSRPAKRRSAPTVDSLRAIPWIFAWSQNRMMLPAWLGAGEALQKVMNTDKKHLLEEMYQQWPFFNTRISMLEMVYAKADMSIMKCYEDKLVEDRYRSLGKDLRQRFTNDLATILSISRNATLMEDLRGQTAQHVAVRNAYTTPLNLLQVELLHRYRQTETPSQALDHALMVTISGIAAGMRNSG